MGAANKKGRTPEERQRAAFETFNHRADDYGQITWQNRLSRSESLSRTMGEIASQKQINEIVIRPYGVLLKYMWELNYRGACHSTSAVLYVLLSEFGLEPKLCIGEVRCAGGIFDHSWVELNGEVFDVAISLPGPGGANAGGPVFASHNLDDGKAVSVKFGIADGTGLAKTALVPLENDLEGYASEQRKIRDAGPDIWHRIIHLAPLVGLQVSLPDLSAKYGSVRREYRRSSGQG